MATLLSSATTNGAGTGASHSGPCTVFVSGTFDGATVTIEVADADTSAKYCKPTKSIVPESRFADKGAVSLNAYGTYFVRAVISNAGASTSINVESTQ